MTSIDKLSYITNLFFNKIEDTKIDLSEEECDNIVNFSKDIRKNLRRLDKIETIIEDYEKYKLKPYKPADDYIRQIKEVFGNE